MEEAIGFRDVDDGVGRDSAGVVDQPVPLGKKAASLSRESDGIGRCNIPQQLLESDGEGAFATTPVAED